jgi:hypothetical protein
MNLSQTCQQTMDIDGGLTTSIFPRIEAWLNESTDHQAALRFIARRKDMNRYRSVIDFILCETTPLWRPACLRFYLDGEKPLRAIASDGELRRLEARMMLFLNIAYAAHQQKRELSWSLAVSLVNDVAA